MIRERTLWTVLESVLLIACAGYWFGNTGLGLAALWLAGPGRLHIESALPLSNTWGEPVWMSQRRVRLRAEDGRRVEYFRDEMSDSEWSALKRRCLSDHSE